MTLQQPFLEKEKQITENINELNLQVKRYTKWAWRSVIGGFIILIIALILFFVPNSEETTIIALNKMEEFAKFLGSIVAAIWTLSGLFFVYVAFLGQKQSIQNQQLELFYNREELKATREELAGQKQQMIEQNKTLRQQQFENTFFKLFDEYNTFLSKNNKSILRIWSEIHKNGDIEITQDDCIKLFNCRIETKQHNHSKAFLIKIILILKFIDSAKIGNKSLYYQLLINQTYSDILFLVYIYSKKMYQNEELKEILEKSDINTQFNKNYNLNGSYRIIRVSQL
jgi:hypothetical protein